MAYVDATTLKGELPFDHLDFPGKDEMQFDAAVDRALDEASELVDSMGKTKFEPTAVEGTFSRPEHVVDHDLPLPKRPIISVESVEVDGVTIDASEYTVQETHLELETDAGLKRWPTDRRSVSVSWTYGFEEVPAPVEGAVIRLARNVLDQIETDGYHADSDGWRYRPPSDIKAECAAMIQEVDIPSYYGSVGVV